ncbi:hypothetical protein AB205_0169280, partial [Aquarana catesbeiana]
MLRWSSALHHSLRLLCTRSARTDTLLDQLKRSTNKYHIFQLVGIHRPVLTLEHVTCAMNLLWQFHKVKSDELSSVDHIRKHPEFISLCTVVENNIDVMEDSELVAILNTVDSLQVDAHSSLVQRLVTEGWRRLERLDPLSLSTFAACLRRQNMTRSPLMGQIASIVDLCLDDVEDPVHMFSSSVPSDVSQTIKAMSLLSPNKIDEVVLSKLDDIIAQCNIYDLSHMTFVVTRLLQSAHMPDRKNLMKLLKELYSYRLKRVSEAKCLDSLILELKNKEIFNQMDTALVEATLHTCQRFIHQLSLKNVIPFSILVLRANTHYSLSPHFLVLTAYALALAGYFPKELIKAIFSTNFLLRFDSQLDALNYRINKRLRLFLMELNRAVCIEHPEYGVPWFHEQYCQQLLQRDFEYILDKERNPIAYVQEDVLPSYLPSMCESDSHLQENKPLPAGAQRVAVDFLHPWALLRNSPHVKGLFAMKKRHLEILGYHVIQ